MALSTNAIPMCILHFLIAEQAHRPGMETLQDRDLELWTGLGTGLWT